MLSKTTFKKGDVIEVVLRDNLYSDRNITLIGKVGNEDGYNPNKDDTLILEEPLKLNMIFMMNPQNPQQLAISFLHIPLANTHFVEKVIIRTNEIASIDVVKIEEHRRMYEQKIMELRSIMSGLEIPQNKENIKRIFNNAKDNLIEFDKNN